MPEEIMTEVLAVKVNRVFAVAAAGCSSVVPEKRYSEEEQELLMQIWRRLLVGLELV